MKLITYYKNDIYGIGTVVDDYIFDISKISKTDNMLSFLNLGEKGFNKVQEAIKKTNKSIKSNEIDGLIKIKETKLAAPIPKTLKNIVCLGLNYAEHVKEGDSNRDLPTHPIFFTKPPTTITGPYDPVIYNKAVKQLDYEVELALVIGKKGKYISKEKAYEHVYGYMVFQDISARILQKQHLQWYRGKSLDTFAPMGPYIVTKDEIEDPMNLNIWCKVNGELRQNANTKDMIFDIETIISTLSDGITLEIGDIIATGTPSGVGSAHPLGLLKIGDKIESGIEHLGTLRNKIIPGN
jgi:2-keto-4-pentenoate hydratase/2-oxohepta-3-ene-1,7-dioic acid hydratase in catechol pathway